MRAGQQEDVPGDLDVDGDVLPGPHVDEAACLDRLDDPLAREEGDGAWQ